MVDPISDVLEPEAVLPVVEERLEVSRRRVDTGAVRVRKIVHEDTVALNRNHVTETVDTERVPIGRVVQGPQEVRHEGEILVVPIVEERMVVHKELVLVEEIRITRRRELRQVPDEVVLRRESAVVERLDPATGQWHAIDPPDVSGDAPPAPARDG